jgi:uncharacterized protein (TIGR03067 family)
MRQLLLVILVALLTAHPSAAQSAKPSPGKLEGTWTVVGIEAAGKTLPVDKVGIEQLTFTGDNLTVKMTGRDSPKYGVGLDTTRKPKWIDWIRDNDQSTLPGIFSLEGEELRLCLPLVPLDRDPGRALLRPENFDTKDKMHMLIVAKRSR